MIVFNLGIVFFNGIVPDMWNVNTTIAGEELGITESNALSKITGLDNPNMNSIWLAITTLAGIGSVVASILTHNWLPIGLYVFGEVFWTSFINMWGVIDGAGYISNNLPGFLIIFFVVMVFVFIAAIIGMITGSG